MKLTIILSVEFVSIWWPCLVVFRLHGNNAGVSELLFSDFLWFFFTPPTDPKPGNSFDAKRIKRGWPNPYGFFLGFINTLLLRISVILSFVLFFVLFSVFCFLFFVCFCLFCFVLFCFFFCRWNKPKLKLFTETLYSHGRFSSAHIKIKSAGIYWLQGQWRGVRARYCAPVHSPVFPG